MRLVDRLRSHIPLRTHFMTQGERLELRERINDDVNAVFERVHAISGTAKSDVYPEGIKP